MTATSVPEYRRFKNRSALIWSARKPWPGNSGIFRASWNKTVRSEDIFKLEYGHIAACNVFGVNYYTCGTM